MRHKITFKKENITPDSAVEEFLENKRLMGLSKATLTTYCDHLNMFLTAVSCDSMDDITQQSISQFVSFMMDRNVTGQTINSYLRTIRVFLRWCAGKEYLGEVKVTMVRSDSRLKDTYTDAELRLLLGHKPKKKEGFRVYQIWVLENYLLATGNRIGSALGLQIQDIDLTEATVRLRRTKGRRQQIIPLQDSLVNIFRFAVATLRIMFFVMFTAVRETGEPFRKQCTITISGTGLLKHPAIFSVIPSRKNVFLPESVCRPSSGCWATKTSRQHRTTSIWWYRICRSI